MAVNLAQDCVHATAQDATALKQVFASLTAESCPKSYNFHMHTVFSDGRLLPEQLMEQALAIGLKGLAITDHHSVDGYRQAQDWLEGWIRAGQIPQGSPDNSQSCPPILWTGVEINADLLNTEVHILCYAFNPDHEAVQPYLLGKELTGHYPPAAQVIEAIHQAGGVAVLAHPVRYKRSPQELVPAAAQIGIDGIEAYYAYNNPSPWQPSPKETQQVLELGKAERLLSTCGTDTHGLSLLQRL
ncbi:MAG: PHP domain-containing protein [Leptolyngbyaceae cyanobacterium CSU_1_4]|nr:PHP domain-containing protein [Leptolyngbyaceae cyanobacterium CSU_1_4]